MWINAFASVGCDDRYLVTLRNPLSVAASIIRGSPHRGVGTGLTHLHLVWLLHMVGALTPAMAGRPTVVVDYDKLMAQPAAELRRIAHGLALADMNETAIDAYGKEFLKGGLRHAAFSAADLAADPLTPPIVNKAYTLLLGAAHDGLDLRSREFRAAWKNIIEEVAQLAPILRVVDEYDAALRRPIQPREPRFTRTFPPTSAGSAAIRGWRRRASGCRWRPLASTPPWPIL